MSTLKYYNSETGKWEYLPIVVKANGVQTVNGNDGDVELNADDIPYDNTESGSSSTNVKEAVDEIFENLSNTGADVSTKADITYVDERDALKADITYVDDAIETKVDKVAGANQLYGTNTDGEQTTQSYSDEATNSTLVKRTATGNVTTTGPTQPEHAVNLEYMEDEMSTYSLTDGRFPMMNIVLDGLADPVSKEIYTTGTYTITDTKKGIIHSGPLELRGRGNSTWGAVKKPWRVKLGTSTKLLGMNAKQKNWALLAMWYDKSRLGNLFAYELGAKMSGLDWTPQIKMVELVLNNSYRGVYQLADLVRLESGRVAGSAVSDAEPTGTWIIEFDNKEGPEGNGSELNGFFTPKWNQWAIWDDPEEPTEIQKNYIVGYTGEIENAIAADSLDNGMRWTDYADPYSFADWWLINEIGRNADSNFYSSCKATKVRNGKLKMGPLWDHDSSFGMLWTSPHSDAIITSGVSTDWRTRNAKWYTELWKIPNWQSFAAARWIVVKQKIEEMGGVESWVDKTWAMLDEPMQRDATRWPTSQENSTKVMSWSADYRKRWIRSRINWLDAQFAGITPTTAPIDEYMETRGTRLYPVDPYKNEY